MDTSVPQMGNCCGVQEKSRDKSKYFEIAHKTRKPEHTENPSPKTKRRVQNGDRKPSNMSDCMHERRTTQKFKLRWDRSKLPTRWRSSSPRLLATNKNQLYDIAKVGNYSIGRFGQIWLQIRVVVYYYEVPPVLVPLINWTRESSSGSSFPKNLNSGFGFSSSSETETQFQSTSY